MLFLLKPTLLAFTLGIPTVLVYSRTSQPRFCCVSPCSDLAPYTSCQQPEAKLPLLPENSRFQRGASPAGGSERTCQGAGAAVGPAGPAVLGDVLVPSGAGVIHPVHVPPVPALRQRRHVQVLVRAGVRPARGRDEEAAPAPSGGGRAGVFFKKHGFHRVS